MVIRVRVGIISISGTSTSTVLNFAPIDFGQLLGRWVSLCWKGCQIKNIVVFESTRTRHMYFYACMYIHICDMSYFTNYFFAATVRWANITKCIGCSRVGLVNFVSVVFDFLWCAGFWRTTYAENVVQGILRCVLDCWCRFYMWWWLIEFWHASTTASYDRMSIQWTFISL